MQSYWVAFMVFVSTAMTLLRTLTPPRQCYVLTLQLPRTMEKRYFGCTLQAVGTSQMFMYPAALLC